MDDFDFVLTLGPGERAWRTMFAVRSIKRHCPEASSYVFIPEEDKPHVPQEVLEEIRELAIIENGELPMKEYPISSKIRALEIAVEQSKADHQILLDSDVALVDRPQIDSNAELMAKPIDISNYYTGSESNTEWEELSSVTGLPEPPRDIKTDVDDKQSRRIYNAGVVATSSDRLPSRWLNLTKDLYSRASRPFQADQIALALLAGEYNFCQLSRDENYPVPHFLKADPEVKILHYHSYCELPKVRTEEVVEELAEIGLMDRYEKKRGLELTVLSAEAIAKVLKRRIQDRLDPISNRKIPKLIK